MVSARYSKKVAGLIGAKEARAALIEIKAEITEGNEIAGPNLDRWGSAVLNVMNSRTPIDTGRLVTGNKKHLVNNYAIEFYNNTPYAGYVHNGTSRMQARPYMENAIDEGREGFPQLYMKNASDFIERVEARHQP